MVGFKELPLCEFIANFVKQRLFTILLKYGLGLGLLAWIVSWYWHIPGPSGEDIGLATVGQRPMDGWALGLAILFCGPSVFLTIFRWFLLVRAQDLPFTPGRALRLGLVGFYFNSFLPGSVGGDIIKAVGIARDQDRRAIAVATVIFDRVVGMLGLILLVVLVGGFFLRTGSLEIPPSSSRALAVLRTIWTGAAGLTMGVVLGWLVLGLISSERFGDCQEKVRKIPRLGPTLAELGQAVWMYRQRGRAVGLALGLAMVGHLGFVLTFYFAAQVLTPADQVPPLAQQVLIVPAGMMVQASTPSPSGLGGGEMGFGFLFEMIGYSAVAGILGSLVKLCIHWGLGLVGYLVYQLLD